MKLSDDRTVFDEKTGLTWQQGGSNDCMAYADAEKYIQKLNAEHFAGHNDWRLPTFEEAMSLLEPKKYGEFYLDPVFDCKQSWFWTADKTNTGVSWFVSFGDGCCGLNDADCPLSVRAVRS